MWPQYTILFMIAVGWGINLAEVGKTRETKIGAIECIFRPAIWVLLLLQGGFFKPLGWMPL